MHVELYRNMAICRPRGTCVFNMKIELKETVLRMELAEGSAQWRALALTVF